MSKAEPVEALHCLRHAQATPLLTKLTIYTALVTIERNISSKQGVYYEQTIR